MRGLTRWNPSTEMTSDPFRQIEEMFEDMWRSWPSRLEGERGFLRPAMDVVESDNNITVRMDLPGVKPEDVNVEIEDNVLTITGELGDTVEKEGDRYHYRERSYGRFQRSIRLPNTLDTDKVDASFEHGVLSVTLPKQPQAQPKRIDIKAGNGRKK